MVPVRFRRQRRKQVEMAPRVDPVALAALQQQARTAAVAKRANNHPMRYRWRQAELSDVEGARTRFPMPPPQRALSPPCRTERPTDQSFLRHRAAAEVRAAGAEHTGDEADA